MNLVKLQVYDPPMCCSSGVCGVSVNPELLKFANDLKWMQQQGVRVERFGLASHPAAFMSQAAVKKALQEDGNDCLPLIVVNNIIVSKGVYPSRNLLMEFAGCNKETFDKLPAEPQCKSGCSCNCSNKKA